MHVSDTVSHYLRATGAAFDSKGCVLTMKSYAVPVLFSYVFLHHFFPSTLTPLPVSANLNSFTSFYSSSFFLPAPLALYLTKV